MTATHRASVRFAVSLAIGPMLVLGCATGPSSLADTMDLGRGVDQGELCKANRNFANPAAKGLFDEAYDLHCRGWTGSEWVGQLFSVKDSPAARQALDAARESYLVCGAAGTLDVPGIGPVEARQCETREKGTAFPAISLQFARNGQLYAASGLTRFAANVEGGLRFVAGLQPDVAKQAPNLAGLPEVPAMSSIASVVAGSQNRSGQHQDLLTYSTRHDYVDARELATGYLAGLPADATTEDAINFRLEAALAESNLDYPESAKLYLDQAAALLAGPGAPTGPERELLATKLKVYRALDALNQRRFSTALTLADSALAGAKSETSAAPVDPLSDPATLRQINNRSTQAARSGGGAIDVRDSSGDAPRVLQAQAYYVRGASLRKLNKIPDAAAALANADMALSAAQSSAVGFDFSNLQWLYSSIAVERALVAQKQGMAKEAGTYFGEGVSRLEAAPAYRDSPLLAQRHLDYANYLSSQGDRKGALEQFDAALVLLRAAGPSATSSVVGLDGYFALLLHQIETDPGAAATAKSNFFEASQMVNPPALSAQISQIRRIFVGGDSDGAVKAKTLQDLDRERRALETQLAGLPVDDAADRAKLQSELAKTNASMEQVRRELSGDQQYLQANDSLVTLAELQGSLRPKEAFLKLLALPSANYGIFVSKSSVSIYKLAVTNAEYTALVKQVRRSIDGDISSSGQVRASEYDVDAAYKLYRLLLGPSADGMAQYGMLIVDVAGPMTELPFGVLVANKSSVDAFNVSKMKNSRDYSSVDFLAREIDLSTTVSPRAFLVARAQPASTARTPYIGFGDHARPTAAELAALPSRGIFKDRCSAQADMIRRSYASEPSISPDELNAAARALGNGSKVVTGTSFTDTAVTTRVEPGGKSKFPGNYSDFEVVHFASHGLTEGALECDSPPALLTSIGDDPNSDGLLSFEEIAKLKFDANLVILSACDTSESTTETRSRQSGYRSGVAGQGATLNGLVRAFLVAGSRSVMTTHWSIPDTVVTRGGREMQVSTPLMISMFSAGGTSTISGVVRTGQSRMIGTPDTSHPLYWGAFTVVGDGSKTMLTQQSSKVADARP